MGRDSFLLRIDPAILASVRQWAEDDMRSVNAQIEFLLRQALRQAGRLPKNSEADRKSRNIQQSDRTDTES